MRAQVQMEVRRQLVAALKQQPRQPQPQPQKQVRTPFAADPGVSLQECVQREVQLQLASMQLNTNV